MSPKFLSKLIEHSEVKAGVLNTYLHRFVIDMTTTVFFRTLEQRDESLFTSETDLSVTINLYTQVIIQVLFLLPVKHFHD